LRVLARDSGDPVRGAPLAVNTVSPTGGAAGWKERFDLSTDEDGGADIPYPPDTSRLDVGVIASGWAARFATWWRSESDSAIPTDYTLRVDRVTNFMGGWLRDAKGRPVANAVVEMEFGAGESAQEETPRERKGFVGPAPVTRSDSRGWWTCALIEPHAQWVPALRARHPAFAPTEIVPRNALDVQNEPIKLLWRGKLVTTMNPGVDLVGRIFTKEGRPVAGAQVEHEPDSFDSIATQSDAQGWFALHGLPPGRFGFFVTAAGLAQTNVTVDLKVGMEPLELRLSPGGVLRLRLVDEDGNPVANGSAAWTGPLGIYLPGGPSMNWRAESGPDGRIEWTSAPTDRRLDICADGPPDFHRSYATVKADGEEHIIQLHHNSVFMITGRVTDARTGELIRKEIKVFPGYGEGMSSWYRLQTRRGTNGLFRLSFDGPFPWRFRVEAEGYSPFVSECLSLDSRGVTDVSLQPTDPSRAVRGTVWRTDGLPAAGAQVALLTPEHTPYLGHAGFTDRALADRLIVNADTAGNFAFPQEPGASLVVAVCDNGCARVPVGDVTTPMEIRLESWGRIEGFIDASASNRPIARVTVDARLVLDTPGCFRLDPREFRSTPSEDGGFAFEWVPPGRFCVWLEPGVMGDPNVSPFHHPTWIQVKPGETAQARISETGYPVKGRFILSGHEGDLLKQPLNAVLEEDYHAEAVKSGKGLGAKRGGPSFFDLGGFVVESNGQFQSRNPITPGTYWLRGRIGSVRLDQTLAVPKPLENGSLNLGGAFSDDEPRVIDLGDIVVTDGEPAKTPRP
jgi:hypothetical protein